MDAIGIVVIGRNEGERLRRALASAVAAGAPCLYVDSGSSDGSVQLAASLGVEVLELDPARPFSAARARNEGFERLAARRPAPAAVQFLDGDCELAAGWLPRAAAALEAHPELTVLCGHVRERDAAHNLYSRLCALEWEKAPGELTACGGVFLVRAEAFRAAGGFRPEVIAAEDDELCLRLRRRGGRIHMLDAEMAVHDVGMVRFSQWWRRAQRAGHAYAQGAALHGRGPERHFVRDCRRIWLWALALPAAALAPAWPSGGWSLLLLSAYPLQWLRMCRNGRGRGWSTADAARYAAFALLAKLPGLQGMLQFHWRRWRGLGHAIIEHKGAPTP